jgi:hypothetical protein
LDEHVEGGLVDYRAFAEDREALDGYIATLTAVTPAQAAEWTQDQRFAFFANAYNAHVVALVLDAYPLMSINDLSTEEQTVWGRPFIALGAHLSEERAGKPISLDELEHRILRPRFEDPRVHVAVNCASMGCPPLDDRAITAEGLDAQLDRLMRAFLADEEQNRFDPKRKRIELSKIFEWFEEDFVDEAGSLAAYLQRYAPTEETAWIGRAEITHREYDWALNDVPRRR